MPQWLGWFAPVINYFNHRWIMVFDHCWIPDDPSINLTGKLSHPLLPNAEWIGVLSRFEKNKKSGKEYQLAVVLSGPEPQRSIFEKIILQQLSRLTINCVLVRGRFDATPVQSDNRNLMIINYLQGAELQSVIEGSELILCRSGYSIVMDLFTLGKKVVFVPTPGQTEQEYIGFEQMNKGIAFCQHQDDFNLEKALREIKNYSGFVGSSGQTNLLDKAIDRVLR